MKGYKLLVLFSVLAVMLFVAGCKRETKAVGPEPVLPDGATLLFANCDPFAQRIGLQESATLVGDGRFACSGLVPFVQGRQATWTSGGFRVPSGSYKEGYHLAFVRALQDAQTAAVFQIEFRGIATHFIETDTIPAGSSGEALRNVTEVSQTGTIGTSDSLHPVSITITCLGGIAQLDLSLGADGSFLKIGADLSTLCQFRIVPDAHGGWSYDTLRAYDINYESASGDVLDNVFLDFTHGAAMLPNHRLQLGDKFGVAYLASEASGCRDTAAYWAFPSTQAYQMTTLRSNYDVGNIISDGHIVWFWDVQTNGTDTLPCAFFRVNADSISGAPIVHHPIYHCTNQYSAYFDASLSLIWLVERGGAADTAWGYSTQGVLDSVVTAAHIPDGHLYRGYWIRDVGHDLLQRSIVETPFMGLGDLPPKLFPAEITEDFAGGAAVGMPGSQLLESWSVNVFDGNGYWIARYPVVMADPAHQVVSSVSILNSDRLITFSIIYVQNGAVFQEVRVLNPGPFSPGS